MKIAFKNFLTTLRRYKVASLLNVLGLTLAFVAFYIIFSQVYYSISYNRPIEHSDRICLISPEWGSTKMGEEESWSLNSPQPINYEAMELCPDVELGASMSTSAWFNRVWVKRGEYNFEKFDIGVYQGNAQIVELFSFEAVAGDLKQVAEPNTVIVARWSPREWA